MALRVTRIIAEVLGELPFVAPSIDLSADSTLSLSSTATLTNKTLGKSASSNLSLSSTATFNTVLQLSAQSELTSTELIIDPDTGIATPTEVGLRQEVSYNATLSKTASTILPLAQSVIGVNILATATDVSADNTLSLTQSAILSETPDSASSLVLTQAADVTVSKPLSNTLELDSTATVVGVWNRPAESELELSQAVGLVYIPAGGVKLCESDIALQGPYSGITSPFSLIYPATGSATDTVELKAPNLGNRDRLAFQRINEETRGGTLIVFADPIWPKVQTLALTFSGLTSAEGQELLRFMREHLGREIRLSDWEQRVWRGIITTPNEPLVQDGPGCQFTASFEFEGELTTP